MGQSRTKLEFQTMKNTTKEQITPQKCILVENPQTLLIMLSNGNMENVSISNQQEDINLHLVVEPRVYFGDKNRIYLVVQTQNLSNQQLLQTVHGYYLATSNKEPHLIQPQKIYLIRQQQKYIIIVESRSLGEVNYKFVDLKDLGRKMKKKQICWQDMEFSQLILRFCRKYSKIKNKNKNKIRNIIIGNDGSVHLLGLFSKINQSKDNIVQNLQRLWLECLYGHEINDKFSIKQLQSNCKFKHPRSLHYIESLQTQIEIETETKYQNIVNPHLKFIRDYITAYHYRLDSYNEKLVDISMALKQWRKAKELLNSYMVANNSFTVISEQNYLLYHKLYKIECMKDKNSPEVMQNMVRISTSANYLALKFKQKNQYLISYKYYQQCLEFSRSKLEEEFYVEMVEVSKALYLNNDSERILMEALALYPYSRILNLIFIIHLCDCMRVDEAQKLLKKVISDFHTLELQLSSAKILLTKAILCPSQKLEFVEQSRDILSNIILQRCLKETGNRMISQAHTIPLYHEIMGDCYLQEKSFAKARDEYQLSKKILKIENRCGFRIASITAAEANCFLMQGKFDESIDLYSQAMSYLGDNCKNLMDSIVGNRAIAKIKKGMKDQGIQQISQVLNSTCPQIVEKDYNYIFLKKFMNSARNN